MDMFEWRVVCVLLTFYANKDFVSSKEAIILNFVSFYDDCCHTYLDVANRCRQLFIVAISDDNDDQNHI